MFYAIGYTNGGANEKRLGPFNGIDEARKAGMREQGVTRGFAFAGVVDEDGGYVYHNSRACNTNFKPGDKVEWKDYKGRYNMGYYVRDNGDDRVTVSIQRNLDAGGLEIPKDWIINSRACNSSNPVVRKAMNAVARNAPGDTIEMKAYRVGCGKAANTLLAALRKFMSEVNAPHILEDMDNRFQDYYRSIANMEMDIQGFIGQCAR